MPDNPYYRNWREVFKWPRIGDRGTGEATNPQGSWGRAGGRSGRTNPQGVRAMKAYEAGSQELGPSAVGTRPADENEREWHVHDIFFDEPERVDRERLVSRHATRLEARTTATTRARQFGVPVTHRTSPGPYTAETSSGYTAQYEQPGHEGEGLN